MQPSRRQFVLLGAGLFGAKAIRASADGLLEVAVEARQEWVQVAGRLAHLYSYNGLVPGPRLEVSPGDTIRLHFTNNLPEPTNLHFHGLHVPPTGTADNVFLEVPPQETFTYDFTVPPDHPPGTFWYHPHLHGRTASQVFRGLAGLLVIRGELDWVPPIAAADEHFLVLQDFAWGASGEVSEPSMMERILGREGPVITASGIVNPELSIAPGGMLRLRILNASPSRHYRLKLEEHPLHLIGVDGGGIPGPVVAEEVLLAPGERIDALVKADRAGGAYRLLNLPYRRATMGMMGMAPTAAVPMTVATVTYEGEAGQDLHVPSAVVQVDPLPSSGLPARQFVLGGAGMGGRGMSFLINGRTFDHRRVDTRVQLGTIEDWEIVNATTMDHPFHLHTNPFQVVDAGGQAEPAWKDVVQVPAGQRRRIRIRFADYAGKSVYHCHILDHEDLGMMGVIETVA